MLSCKQITLTASEYLDGNAEFKWQMRLHLMMCANCRRFVKHLKITRKISSKLTLKEQNMCDAENVWQNLQRRLHQQTHNQAPPQGRKR